MLSAYLPFSGASSIARPVGGTGLCAGSVRGARLAAVLAVGGTCSFCRALPRSFFAPRALVGFDFLAGRKAVFFSRAGRAVLALRGLVALPVVLLGVADAPNNGVTITEAV